MRSPLVSSSVSLTGAVPSALGRSRIATFGRLFEGTDEISLGQTTVHRREKVDISHSRHGLAVAKNRGLGMLQNGWH